MKYEVSIGGVAGALAAVWSDYAGWQAIAFGAAVALIAGGLVRGVSLWRASRAKKT